MVMHVMLRLLHMFFIVSICSMVPMYYVGGVRIEFL